MLTNVKEKGFFEVYGTWAKYGYGVMLIYQEPPVGDSRRFVCEYVLFKPDDSPKKEVINQDLLDLYNKGEQ